MKPSELLKYYSSRRTDSMSEHDSREELLIKDDGELLQSYQRRLKDGQRSRLAFGLIAGNILLFIFSIATLLYAKRPYKSNLGDRLVSSTDSIYTPISDHVDLSQPVVQRVDGSLFTTTNESIFRGDPSPEIDAAWDGVAAEHNDAILINSTELKRAGFDPSEYFKMPLEWGHGDDAYPVQIDVFHQLHCLNSVRKQMYYDYYFKEKYGGYSPPEFHWKHQKHCLHLVLQGILCHANTEILPHRWVEKEKWPSAQFSIKRQCRNFDKLHSWNMGYALPGQRPRWKTLQKPPDAFVWPDYGEQYDV